MQVSLHYSTYITIVTLLTMRATYTKKYNYSITCDTGYMYLL